jgi:hypothetical protein
MEGAMLNRNNHSAMSPAAFIGWMMERVYEICIDSAMYRMAPTRKL